jgi:hypothetical protein
MSATPSVSKLVSRKPSAVKRATRMLSGAEPRRRILPSLCTAPSATMNMSMTSVDPSPPPKVVSAAPITRKRWTRPPSVLVRPPASTFPSACVWTNGMCGEEVLVGCTIWMVPPSANEGSRP